MDWKLNQQRREKVQALLNKESAQKVTSLGDMECDFKKIFGEEHKAGFSVNTDKSGGKAWEASSSSRLGNSHKNGGGK